MQRLCLQRNFCAYARIKVQNKPSTTLKFGYSYQSTSPFIITLSIGGYTLEKDTSMTDFICSSAQLYIYTEFAEVV
jgi:hypothetical protein